jgi:DNA-directed RNA polymerase subunit RPC12/RpoP
MVVYCPKCEGVNTNCIDTGYGDAQIWVCLDCSTEFPIDMITARCIFCQHKIVAGEKYAIGLHDFIHMACLYKMNNKGTFMTILKSNLIMENNEENIEVHSASLFGELLNKTLEKQGIDISTEPEKYVKIWKFLYKTAYDIVSLLDNIHNNCKHYDRTEFNVVMDGMIPPVTLCRTCGKLLGD